MALLTRTAPARATSAHISIIGHITDTELRRHTTTAPAARFFAAVSAAGQLLRGNATSGGSVGGVGSYNVGFAQDVSSCVYTATLGSTDGSDVPPGRITVSGIGGKVAVKTFDAAGSPADLPFHLIVAC